eukprot:GILI01034764.1.p1 GENE.GILI01034764.1~~GILI01034764.1.p1  ORF type:complete len:359 (+),score=49.25 GILI01034764.1:62-1138(+)
MVIPCLSRAKNQLDDKPKRRSLPEKFFIFLGVFACWLCVISNVMFYFQSPLSLRPVGTIWNFGIAMQADARLCSSHNWHDTYGKVFFVCFDDFEHFIIDVLPSITSPFVLVTGDADATAPYEYPNSTKVLNHPMVAAWWSQNSASPKVQQYPIGIDFHSRSTTSSLLVAGSNLFTVLFYGFFERPASSQAQEQHLLQVARDAQDSERLLRIYCDFHFNGAYGRSFQNSTTRSEIRHALKKHPLIDWATFRSSRASTWQRKVKYAFELSIPGNGIDCHRTWEALVLGIIVITVPSPLDPLFEGLPVVIVKDLRQITEANLRLWHNLYRPMFKTKDVRKRLKNKYWIDEMRASLAQHKSL